MIAPRRASILLWLISIAALLGIVARIPFTSDMSAFMPKTSTPEQQVLADQLRDGIASRLILVGIEGANSTIRAALSKLIAQQLRKRSEFVLVDNGDGSIGEADLRFVWQARYLLSSAVTPEQFSVAGLRRAMARDLELLASRAEPLFKESIASDPTGEAANLARTFVGDAHREIHQGVWTAKDGRRALVLTQTRAPGFDIDAQAQALSEITRAFAISQSTVQESRDARLLTSGPGVFGVKIRAEMKHDISLYSTGAMALIVLLLLALYRSPHVLILTLIPVLTAALSGLAAVFLCFGFVHGITVGFGVTLIGEAVDYAIYLFVQSKGPGGTQANLQRIWPTLRIGTMVSICGFSAMLFSSFTGFVQLGIFTMVGLAVALAVTRFVLPNMVPADFAWSKEIAIAPVLLRMAHGAWRMRPVVLIVTVCAAGFIVSRSNDLWSEELSSMSPISTADQRLDRDLRRDIGAPDVRYLIIATAPTREALLEICEHTGALLQTLITQGVLTGFDTPVRYLPSMKTQQIRSTALPDHTTLANNLRLALAGTPFREEAFTSFLDEVEVARTSAPLTRDSLDGTAVSLKLDSLLVERPGRWMATLPLRDVNDPQRISKTLAATATSASASTVFLDLKSESDLLLQRYRHEALTLALLGSIAITALLFAYFRSFQQTAITLAPLVVSIIVTVALLTLMHGRLSIFNLFGLLLVIAVSSNYCLFFQRGGMLGESGGRTITSLLAANVCTVVGFGALSISRMPVLYDIGRTVAIGTAISLVTASILIPHFNSPSSRIPPIQSL